MYRQLLLILLILPVPNLEAAANNNREDTVIYLFPGQGADYRQYRDIAFPPGYDTVHITYPVPHKHERMRAYALRFIPLIDRERPYVLMGVSLGGMICTELADTLEPVRVILVSSAKGFQELPGRYTFMRKFHLNRVVPKAMVKGGSRILQGLVEPDKRYDPETFNDMLRKKDPLYLKRTVDMIVNWNRTGHHPDIVHIHGTSDHTIPPRHVEADYWIEDGSHMMILTRAPEISRLLKEIL